MQPNFRTPPPTGQTEHARGLKFSMGSPHGSVLRVTEAIFDKSPLSRDMGVGRGTLRPIMTTIFFLFSYFLAMFSLIDALFARKTHFQP